MEIKKPYIINDLNDQRSAIEPVGIVAVVSINTIWKRKRANTPTSYTSLPKKYPAFPITSNGFPNKCQVTSWVKPGVPPNGPRGPTPPNINAKPHIQNPNRPST